MYRWIRQTGVLAVSIGGFTYLCHSKHRSHTVYAKVDQEDTVRKTGSLSSPQEAIFSAEEGSPQLQLLQVQVVFRHGARSPLHLIPKIPEVNYDPKFLLKEHQASVFPYERLQYKTGQPVDWSDYEQKLTHTPLKSGVPCGALTTLGKEQVYILGQRLQNAYRHRLNLAEYSPEDVLVLSSNIKRTVESARGVLAGFFGKEHLQMYAKQFSPVKIYILNSRYNILIPDVTNCDVLKKVNHAGILHSDLIPGFKANRLAIEKTISEAREAKIEVVKTIQEKINKIRASTHARIQSLDHGRSKNSESWEQKFWQLIQERNGAIDHVERFWAYALVRNPNLASSLTESDMRALVYLSRLEVEGVEMGQPPSGYTLHLYFDPNPYFENTYLCKKVYNNRSGAATSWSTPIIWKEYGKALQDEIHKEEQTDNDKKNPIQSNQKEDGEQTKIRTQTSFFKWYVTPAHAETDHIGKTIRDEVWPDPVSFFETKTAYKDKWDRTFNFVFARDDLVCRKTHGLACPEELKQYEEEIDGRATTMMYYAMTGQHSAERGLVACLCAGPLLTAMVDECQKVIKGDKQGYKMCLYSSHDSTMSGLLEVLSIWDNRWPPFAADLRLELYKEVDGSEFYVRVLYCGQVCQVRGQKSGLVPWSQFVSAVSSYLIREDEYWKTCACDVVERCAKDLLQHVEGEVVKPTQAPAGM